MLCVLKRPNDPDHVILVKQFRPPLHSISIEMPAGLVDGKETVAEAALRELKEETGYVGVIKQTSPIIYNDPGMTNANHQMVLVEVRCNRQAPLLLTSTILIF
jgi:ADP-ribose pyrophosphatase